MILFKFSNIKLIVLTLFLINLIGNFCVSSADNLGDDYDGKEEDYIDYERDIDVTTTDSSTNTASVNQETTTFSSDQSAPNESTATEKTTITTLKDNEEIVEDMDQTTISSNQTAPNQSTVIEKTTITTLKDNENIDEEMDQTTTLSSSFNFSSNLSDAESVGDYDDYGGNEEIRGDNSCGIDLMKEFTPDDMDTDLKPVKHVQHINETLIRIERLKKLGAKWMDKAKKLVHRLAPEVMDLIYLIDLPPGCLIALGRVLNGILSGEIWALKFPDSYGLLFLSGLLEANIRRFGEYDECLAIESPFEEGIPTIHGKYCMISPVIPYPPRGSYKKTDKLAMNISEGLVEDLIEYLNYFNGSMLMSGICIPSDCKGEDIAKALNNILFPIFRLPIDVTLCKTKDYKPVIDDYQKIAIFTFMALAILVILSTFCELLEIFLFKTKEDVDLKNKRNKLMVDFLTSFSIIRNSKILIKDKSHSYSSQFQCLENIRFISTLLAMLTHYYFIPILYLVNNKGQYQEDEIFPWNYITHLKHHFFRIMILADINFMINGIITSYIMISYLEKKRTFNYLYYLISRYLRLVAPLFGSILVFYLLPIVGDGPLWEPGMQYWSSSCKLENKLISTLMMGNNFGIDFSNGFTCNPGSWWLAASFQLHIIAPLIFIPLAFCPISGVILNILVILLGCFVSMIPKYFFNTTSIREMFFRLPFMEDANEAFEYDLTATWLHISTYFFGILIGYFIKKHPNLSLGGKIGQISLWCITCGISFATIFGVNTHIHDLVHLLIWIGFGKLGIMVVFGYAIFMCLTGRANWLRCLLTGRQYLPWTRLSLGVYLLHLPVLAYRMASVKRTDYINDYNILSGFFFDLFLTFILSYLIHILMSQPVYNLSNINFSNLFMSSSIYFFDTNKDLSLNKLNNRQQMNGKSKSKTWNQDDPTVPADKIVKQNRLQSVKVTNHYDYDNHAFKYSTHL